MNGHQVQQISGEVQSVRLKKTWQSKPSKFGIVIEAMNHCEVI